MSRARGGLCGFYRRGLKTGAPLSVRMRGLFYFEIGCKKESYVKKSIYVVVYCFVWGNEFGNSGR